MNFKNLILSWSIALFSTALDMCFIFGLPALFIAVGAYIGWWNFSWIPIILLTFFLREFVASQRIAQDTLTFSELSGLLDEEDKNENKD